MWSSLPGDLLANILSFLSPDCLARAMAVCTHWHTSAKSTTTRRLHPPSFLALPTRTTSLSCTYIYNPTYQTWHSISLNFIPTSSRPITTVNGGLVLFKSTISTSLQLSVCNPFVRQFKHLPLPCIARTNPAVGVIQLGPTRFTIYLAGGMSDASDGGGASYEPTVEMYNSRSNRWKMIGSMPVEFAVRLTVWSPNECVYSNGVLYWMTSARAYSIMGFEVKTKKWKEHGVPMGDTLEFASLVLRDGQLTLVGGCGNGGDVWIWELGADDEWDVVEKVGLELKARFLKGKGSWESTKCVGVEGAMCLYREFGLEMLVWNKVCSSHKWEWCWIKGCCSSSSVPKFSIKGVLIHPDLSESVC